MRDRISDGKGPLGFIIEQNFTESLRTRYAPLIAKLLIVLLSWLSSHLLLRYQQVCEAHFNSNINYPSTYVIQYSTIDLYVDATGRLLIFYYVYT